MLSQMARKFKQAGYVDKTYFDRAGEHLCPMYKIKYGNYSNRLSYGMRTQNATLLRFGKPVAFYDATTDEIYI